MILEWILKKLVNRSKNRHDRNDGIFKEVKAVIIDMLNVFIYDSGKKQKLHKGYFWGNW